MRKHRLYFFLLGLGILTIFGAVAYNRSTCLSLSQVADNTSSLLEEKMKACQYALNELTERPDTCADRHYQAFQKQHIGLYRFRNDSLIYWNNARWAIHENPSIFKDPRGLAKLSNGFFLYVKNKRRQQTDIAVCMVKPLFKLQNNYLNNAFCDWLGIPAEIELDEAIGGKYKVMSGEQGLFSLKGGEQLYADSTGDQISLLAFLAGLVLILSSLLLICKAGPGGFGFALILSGVVAARGLMLAFKWPEFLSRGILYDPRLFGNAQSFLNGFLGDVVFNALVLLFIALALHFYFKEKKSGITHYLPVIAFSVLTLVLFGQFNRFIISLVNNSTLNFNFLSIFSIRPIVLVALVAAGLLSLALFVCVNNMVALLRGRGFVLFAILHLVICILLHWFSGGQSIGEHYWLLPYALLLYFAGWSEDKGLALALGLHVLAMSVVTSSFLNLYIGKNQALDLEILTQRLGERQDEILESEFAGLPQKIAGDETLKNLVDLLPESEKELEQKLRQSYFNGYFDRYEIEFSLFDKNCRPLLNTKSPVLLNSGFFEDRINLLSEQVTDGLFFVKGYPRNTQYIAETKLGNYNLFALIEAKQFEEAGSFPDLFLDQSLQKQNKLRSFAYAVYRSGQNTNRYGDFNYPYFFQDSGTLAKSAPGYIHYYFEPEPDTRIVISQAVKNWKYFFTFNSYLLLFFSLLIYGCYLVYGVVFTNEFKASSLTRRIQTIIILLLLFAMSAVGITSGKLVTGQFEADNKKQLEEKTSVIISELSGQFSTSQLFDESQRELLNTRLKEYSRLFNTPISLFAQNGMLFNTSEPKLYDFGLAAPYANPQAYYELSHNLTSAVCVNEMAGTLNYLSFYTPLFNKNKQLNGFINLPYFAKQSDLTSELSEIISALINVYVILFVLSIVAGLILSGYITQPLRLIKQQLAKITLGRHNEKITWQSNDEIGKLVAEYNLMLLKLEESANMLARSERESAWREMAKQVAHEIKNPLTPMKLNLQYLQHLMKNNPGDFKERFEKASAGIIEQIDALASIATEFSNFAKLPGASLQSIQLAELIHLAVHVFENQKNLKLDNRVPENSLLVLGDREQCLRVFNNVLKNAIQATEALAEAEIVVGWKLDEDKIVVYIKDNGCGIEETLKSKIFSPNFTTKSTGSGLGLAMVKNIMEGFGGRIWFESEEGKGSTFYLEFKLA